MPEEEQLTSFEWKGGLQLTKSPQ